MSHPAPGETRIKFTSMPSSLRTLYHAWLEPEHIFLGLIEKVSAERWRPYERDSVSFIMDYRTRAAAGRYLRRKAEER